MVHLSPEDFRRCSEFSELDDVCNSLVDIRRGISWHIEEDSFCVLSCMLHIKMRKIQCVFCHNKERAPTWV